MTIFDADHYFGAQLSWWQRILQLRNKTQHLHLDGFVARDLRIEENEIQNLDIDSIAICKLESLIFLKVGSDWMLEISGIQ